MNWPLVALVAAIAALTLAFWLKHQGDMLYGRVIDAVAQRNKIVLKADEREWCVKEACGRWVLMMFLGFITISMGALFPDGDGEEAMLDAAAARCEDTVVHALMHYRQDHSEP